LAWGIRVFGMCGDEGANVPPKVDLLEFGTRKAFGILEVGERIGGESGVSKECFHDVETLVEFVKFKVGRCRVGSAICFT